MTIRNCNALPETIGLFLTQAIKIHLVSSKTNYHIDLEIDFFSSITPGMTLLVLFSCASEWLTTHSYGCHSSNSSAKLSRQLNPIAEF